jgi:cytochrome c-type biogenesis protein CcmE
LLIKQFRWAGSNKIRLVFRCFTKKSAKSVLAIVIIGLAAAWLLYQASSSSWVYYYSVDEFVNSPLYAPSASIGTKTKNVPIVRIAGLVKSGTVVSQNMQLNFELAGSKKNVTVQFKGPQPANFAEDKEVVIEGKIGPSGIFLADKILTRCESKYKVKLKSEAR